MEDVIHYTRIPTVTEFRRDSGVAFAIRGGDRILSYLDWLLDRYHFRVGKGDHDRRCVALCGIFTTTHSWMKSYYQKNSTMRHEWSPAIAGLFERTKYELSFVFGCREPEVGCRITQIFGRDLDPEGERINARQDAAYHDMLRLNIYRLRFRGGRVYQLCQGARDRGRFAPVDSRDFYEAATVHNRNNDEAAERFEDWGPFVMTLQRDFYLDRHKANSGAGSNIFDSAYTRSAIISATGTMLIRNGEILGIRGHSGYYKPPANNMTIAVTKLGRYSVPLSRIAVYSWAGQCRGTALEFVRSCLTWEQFVEGIDDDRALRNGEVPEETGPAARAPPVPTTFL
jgi:hypothetical protein